MPFLAKIIARGTAVLLKNLASGIPRVALRQSSELAAFKKIFASARNVVFLTGAGISAESGVPTFRGAGGLWRKYRAADLATPEAFEANPSLVWEFYHYRREIMQTTQPNKGHFAIAEAQTRLSKEGRSLTVITQNIDELHQKAGTKAVIEMHGNLFTTRCTSCLEIKKNYENPVCPALSGRGAPEPNARSDRIPEEKLPRCQKPRCGALLRPHIVFFNEPLELDVLAMIDVKLRPCDLFIVVGTSAMVFPAAGYAQIMAARGIPVAEFNIEATPATHHTEFYFEGPSGETLPTALAP